MGGGPPPTPTPQTDRANSKDTQSSTGASLSAQTDRQHSIQSLFGHRKSASNTLYYKDTSVDGEMLQQVGTSRYTGLWIKILQCYQLDGDTQHISQHFHIMYRWNNTCNDTRTINFGMPLVKDTSYLSQSSNNRSSRHTILGNLLF